MATWLSSTKRTWPGAPLAAALLLLSVALAAALAGTLSLDLRMALLVRVPRDVLPLFWVDGKKKGDYPEIRAGGPRPAVFPLPHMPIASLQLRLGGEPDKPELFSLRVYGLLGLGGYSLEGDRLRRAFRAGVLSFRTEKEGNVWLVFGNKLIGTFARLQHDKIFSAGLTLLLAALIFGYLRGLDPGILQRRPPWKILSRGGAVLVLLTFAPLAAVLLGFKSVANLEEKRTLIRMPDFRFEAVFHSLRDYTTYFDDHFPFRNELIILGHYVMAKGLGTSSLQEVLLGRDGWLFADGVPSAVEYFRGVDLLSESELDAWEKTLEQRRRWLAKRGIEYLFLIAPNSNTLYPEAMPGRIHKARQTTRMDQLLEALKKNTRVRAPDVRPALLAAKALRPVYARTDSHWNDYGAFIAAREVISALVGVLPGAVPPDLSRYRISAVEEKGGDLAECLGLDRFSIRENSVVLEPVGGWSFTQKDRSEEWVVTENPAARLPGLLCVGDSFFKKLLPFLAEQFVRGNFITDAHDAFFPDLILQEKPRLFIDELTERKLLNWPIPLNPPEIIEDH